MDNAMQPEDTPELRALYEGFERNHMNPLWTRTAGLMPQHPKPKAVPYVWKWADLLPMAEQSGDLVPVGRGGERRHFGEERGNRGAVGGDETRAEGVGEEVAEAGVLILGIGVLFVIIALLGWRVKIHL